jgi:hypothetical protein
MTTSGTYTFGNIAAGGAPSLGEMTLYAYNLIGIRPASILQEHLESARMASNLMLGRWSSQGVNLWAVDLTTVSLVQGTSTYTVDPSTIVMLDAYVTVGTGTSATNLIIMPISRTEYANYPNKTQQGRPTVFWFDRLLSPTVTLWPVPDGSQVSFSYYRVRQIQDANLQNGQQVEIPTYWLEAFSLGLALRLAMIWAPDKVQLLKSAADEAYQIASSQNVETSQYYISPMVSSYFRP